MLLISSLCCAQTNDLRISLTEALKPHSEMLYVIDEIGDGRTLSVYGSRLTQDSLDVIARYPVSQLVVRDALFTDLSPLKENELNEFLAYFDYVSEMSLQGIGILTNMPLRALALRNAGLTDFDFLNDLPYLQTLEIGMEEHLTNLCFASRMALLSLNVRETGITNLNALAGSSLEVFDASGCRISDLTPLSGLPLREVYLSRTDVTDLSPLRNAPLDVLHLEDALVSDLSILAGEDLEHLQLSGISSNVLPSLRVGSLKHVDISPAELNAEIISILSEIPGLITLNYQGFESAIKDLQFDWQTMERLGQR